MPLLFAHRGLSAEAPENTIVSIQSAIDFNVDGIEFDVHLSKDEVPVVIHDPTVCRTTTLKKRIRIEHLTLNELQQLDAGSWFDPKFSSETIPSLSDILKLERKSTQFMIELKKGTYPAQLLVKNVAQCLKGSSNFIVGSFDIEILTELLKLSPRIPTIGIIEDLNMLPHFVDMGLKNLALWYKIISLPLMQSLNEQGIEVWSFTIDDPKVCQFLLSIKTNGIITNNPRKLRKYFP